MATVQPTDFPDATSNETLDEIAALLGLQATDATVEAVRALLDSRLPTLENGRLPTTPLDRPTTFAEGTLTLNGDQVVLDVPAWAHSVVFRVIGSTGGSIAFDFSLDGVQWDGLLSNRTDSLAIPSISTTTTGTTSWVGSLPPGAAKVRMRASSAPTTPITTQVGFSNAVIPIQTGVSGSVTANQTSTNRQGLSANPGVWTEYTTVALGAGATYTGASVALGDQVSGTAFQSGHYFEEFRAMSAADQPGTLYLEVSANNTVWRRVRAVPTTQSDPSCLHVAEMLYRPSFRYVRLVYINGPTAQGQFNLDHTRMAG